MAKKKFSPLVQAITLFNQLDERDKGTFTEYVRAQVITPRKASTIPAQKEPKAVVPPGLCSYKFDGKTPCLAAADNAIHDPNAGYGGYHPFVSTVTSARTVRRRSSRNTDSSKADGVSPVSLETDSESASSAQSAAAGAGD